MKKLLKTYRKTNVSEKLDYKLICLSIFSNNGGGNLGDVNISALLTSFQTGYDKRVRPNYGGKTYRLPCSLIIIRKSPLTKSNDVEYY